jgi:arsenite transporter
MADALTTKEVERERAKGLGVFERFLSVWVALCIVAGVAIGQFLPLVPETLQRFTYAEVSIPIAILIWLMIFPMMLQIDFGSVLGVRRQPKGLTITLVVNWLIKPFSMLFFAGSSFRWCSRRSSPRSWHCSTSPARSCSAPRRAPRWCSCGAT